MMLGDNDVVADAQAEPSPLSNCFGGEERRENLVAYFIRNSRPVIGNRTIEAPVGTPCQGKALP